MVGNKTDQETENNVQVMIIKNKKWDTTTYLYIHLRDESNVICGTVDKNLPFSAGYTGSISAPGRSHLPWSNWARVPQLLSPHSRDREPQLRLPSPRAATTELTRLELVLCNKGSHWNEKPAHHSEDSPCSLQLQRARAKQGKPSAGQNEYK